MNTNTGNFKTFHLDFTSEISGERYTGVFTIKRFTVKDISTVAVRKTQLNGGLYCAENGMGVDPETDGYNNMIATIEVGLTAAPPWYRLEEIYDIDLISRLAREVNTFQATFRAKRGDNTVGSAQTGASQERSGKKSEEANQPRDLGAVVGSEVLATLEP